MKNRFMILCFAVFVLLPSLIFTQTKSGGIIQTNKNPNQAFTKFKNDPPLSAEDQSLLNKIIKIKNSPDLSRSGELNQLLKIYNQRNGIIEKPAENYEGAKIISPEKEIETQTDHVYSG